MTRKTWSDSEVSAYLDGAMRPQDQAAFETDIAQNPDLHRRVEEVEQVVTLVQAVPLRQPPRNYLLTPSMVAKTEPTPTKHSRSLWIMRLATSITAAAFAITFGLTLVQRGVTPGMVPLARKLEPAFLMQDAASVEESAEEREAAPLMEMAEAEEMPVEEAPAAQENEPAALESEPAAQKDESGAEVAQERVLRSQDDDSESGSMAESETTDEGLENDTETGIGGGGEAPLAEEELAIAPSEPAAEAMEPPAAMGEPPAAMGEPPEEPRHVEDSVKATEVGEAFAAPLDAEGSGATEEQVSVAAEAESLPEMEQPAGTNAQEEPATWETAPDVLEIEDEAVPSSRRLESTELTVGLGITTVVLAAITVWLSRRRSI